MRSTSLRIASVALAGLLASACASEAVGGGRWGYVVGGGRVRWAEPPTNAVLPFTPADFKEMPDTDAKTFVVLRAYGIAKDKHHVYVRWQVLAGADSAKYRLYDNSAYGTDGVTVWYMDQKLLGARAGTFRVTGSDSSPASTAHQYATDGISAWWFEQKLEGADGANFRVTGDYTATDGTHTYIQGRRAPE